MHFLLLNQFFAPDPAPTGQLLADVARELAARGHSVTVICARAGYAPSASGPPLAGPSIRVIRTRSAPFARNLAGRLLSYLSFYLGAIWHGLRVPRPDVVVTLTTPPLLCLAGAFLRGMRGGSHYTWEMDVYPDIAVAAGVLPKRSRLTRLIGIIADRCRRNADGVIALGPCMRDRLIARGLRASNIHIVHNWADGSRIRPEPLPSAQRLILLYSGNLGLAHDTATLLRAMQRLKDDSRFRFVFAGGGTRRRAFEDSCCAAGIRYVTFTGYKEAGLLSHHLASCHIGIVTQTAASAGAVIPSKIYGLMAAGRPLLFIGPRRATPARIIENFRCGWQIDPGDSASLVALLDLAARDPELVARAGRRAREAFETGFDLASGVSRIVTILGLPPAVAQDFTERTQFVPSALP